MPAPLATVEHLPGLRTDACRLCSRHRRPPRRLTLCVGCPEAVRQVHLELHVCPPAAPVVVPVGQLGLDLTAERGAR